MSKYEIQFGDSDWVVKNGEVLKSIYEGRESMGFSEIQDTIETEISFSGIHRLKDSVEVLDSKQGILKNQIKDVFGCILANEALVK